PLIHSIQLPIPYERCVPATIPFQITIEYSKNINGVFYLANTDPDPSTVFWDFGDGQTSNQLQPTHTYTAQGDYYVVVSYITNEGCAVVDTQLIEVGTKVQPNFSIVGEDTLCAGVDSVTITDYTTGQDIETAYTFYPYDPIKAVPPHAFTNPNAAVTSYNFPVPGIYDSVIAITYNNACPDTAILYDTFVVQGQISLFDFEIDCDTPTLVRFKDSTSSDHYTRVWLFGDGNSDT